MATALRIAGKQHNHPTGPRPPRPLFWLRHRLRSVTSVNSCGWRRRIYSAILLARMIDAQSGRSVGTADKRWPSLMLTTADIADTLL